MEKQTSEKSRRERRKETRLAKNATKHQSWLQHQKSRAMKRVNGNSKDNTTGKSNYSVSSNNVKEMEVMESESNTRRHNTAEECAMSKDIAVESELMSSHGSVAAIKKKRKKGSKENARKKVREFYEMDMANISIAAKKDQELERKFAKKLKVKNGKLRGMDDGLNILLDGMVSVIDFMAEEEVPGDELPSKTLKKKSSKKKPKNDILSKEGPDAGSIYEISRLVETSNQDVASEEFPASALSSKTHKTRKLLEQQQEGNVVDDTSICAPKPVDSRGMEVQSKQANALVPEKRTSEKYTAPHLRSRAGNEPEEHTQIRRRVRGLLNRLSESNVESITGEISMIFQSIARSIASQIISEEILASCSRGPRGNEQLRILLF